MNIDLGKSMEAGPSVPAPEKDSKKTYYPTLYIDGSEALKALPESGTMTVAFKRCSQTVADRGGETCCSVSLDITKILDIEPDASTGAEKEDTVSILEDMAEEMGGEGEEDKD